MLKNMPIWKIFEEEARKRQQDPTVLIAGWIRQCLEIWEDEAMDEAIGSTIRKSGYQEQDAVNLVRQLRLEKRADAPT